MSGMWYNANDVMLLLKIGESTAYKVIGKMRSEISKKKIPGKDICYAKPPQGKIQKSYFCEKYMLDVAECDAFLEMAMQEVAS